VEKRGGSDAKGGGGFSKKKKELPKPLKIGDTRETQPNAKREKKRRNKLFLFIGKKRGKRGKKSPGLNGFP